MNGPYNTTDTLIVALDIGKNVHCLGCYDGHLTELVPPRELRSDLEGFAQFRAIVDPLLASGRFRQALIGNEPTGVYHEPWAWQIQAAYLDPAAPPACPVTYHWLNPLLSKRRREQSSVRKRSTDALAVVAIAACLADGVGYPAYLPDAATAQLIELVRTWEQQQQQVRHLARQLLPQIDRLWPGAIVDVKKFQQVHPDLPAPLPLVESDPLNRARVAALLLHAPNPYTILAWTADELIVFLRQHVGRGGPRTAERIFAVLRQAPLPPPALATVLAARLQADYQVYHAAMTRATATETALTDLVPNTAARFVDSIPGIGALLAGRYCAAIGNVTRFPSAAHVWAFAGWDPMTDDSGDRRRTGQISRRGAPFFRDTLFLIGLHTAQHCPSIGQTFLDARERGLPFPKAVIHAAHKANRLCFALLREQRGYRPDDPAIQQAWEKRVAASPPKGSARRRPHAAPP